MYKVNVIINITKFVLLCCVVFSLSMYYLYSSILMYRARVILNLHTANFRKYANTLHPGKCYLHTFCDVV